MNRQFLTEALDRTRVFEMTYRRIKNSASFYNGIASRTGGITIACGMARFEADECVASVFERADSSMYENKKALKTARHDTDA